MVVTSSGTSFMSTITYGPCNSLGHKRFRAALHPAGRSHALRHRGESLARPAPLELFHIAKERRVGAERGEPLEEKRRLATLTQHLGRETLDRAVSIQK